MSERNNTEQTTYERVTRALAKPVLGALGALAFFGGAAAPALAARSKSATSHEQPSLSTPLAIDAAAILKNRLVHHQVVTFDAFQGVNWGPGEASTSTVCLNASIDGKVDYFNLTQTQPNKHGSLRTLRVTELTDLAPDPDTFLPETFPGITSLTSTTQSGVVFLGPNKLPVVKVPGVEYSNGKPLFALVGQTTPNPNALAGATPSPAN